MLGSSVIRILPGACSEKSTQVMNNGNEIGRSVTVSVNLENRGLILNDENVTCWLHVSWLVLQLIIQSGTGFIH